MCSALPLLYPRNTVAAIARPARTTCLRGHRENKRSSVARVSTVGARGSNRVIFEKRVPCTHVESGKRHTRLQRKETADSSAWNHIFRFQRRGPPGRKVRKLMSLRHTHGSAPKSPCPPCQNTVQRKRSELLVEQN